MARFLPVRDLASRLGAEASDAAGLCEDFQSHVAAMFTAKAVSTDALQRAQILDRMSQQIRAIACALHALAEASEHVWTVPGASLGQGILLAEVADRIQGRASIGRAAPHGRFDDAEFW